MLFVNCFLHDGCEYRCNNPSPCDIFNLTKCIIYNTEVIYARYGDQPVRLFEIP